MIKKTSVKENPLTGTSVYYPPCTKDRIYAYHGISGRIDPDEYDSRIIGSPQEMIASEKTFRQIWKDGFIYSNRIRVNQGFSKKSSMFFAADRIAGDDEYVFLSLCEPHAIGSKGYHLVFDPYGLVEAGALVGLVDLQSFYISIAENLEVEDRFSEECWKTWQVEQFLEIADDVQDIWRLKGLDAWMWLEWVQGIRKKYPVNVAALRWVDRQIRAHMHNRIRWITMNKETAVRSSEVLVKDELSFDDIVGVIFRKKYYEIDDFVNAYGSPGGDPPDVMTLEQAIRADSSSGHPIRCPVCGDYFYLEPLDIENSSIWNPVFPGRVRVPGVENPLYVMVCQSCDAAIARESFGPYREQELYLGQYSDLEHIR